jgi:predicted 3-demethylubiquinone-9 3-methyltransferase (glyoxalase superfamily)
VPGWEIIGLVPDDDLRSRRGQHREEPPHSEERPVPRITPMLWFDTQALEAAEFYCSIFPNSEIRTVTHYGEAGPRAAGMVLTVDFVLDGQQVTALNGGPEFTFDEAVSFVIHCADQAEVDHYWYTLTEDGEEGPCGWCKDRYGLSWQVVPAGFEEIMRDPDAARRDRAMKAMLGMRKLDLAVLRAAADATPAT